MSGLCEEERASRRAFGAESGFWCGFRDGWRESSCESKGKASGTETVRVAWLVGTRLPKIPKWRKNIGKY